MLAEPRRRTKYSTDPRGLQWSQDGQKFGQRMLEKMGWEKGKGLGANEDGKKDHITVSVKGNNRGVGCSKSFADNWVAHQDDFNALLANLNQTADDTDKNTDTVQNLEDRGRQLKGRLHYQKFAKGKNLSNASNVDLDCIFGRRKSKSAPNTPDVQSEASSDAESVVSEPERTHGIMTTTSTMSVQEYFAQKMAALRGGARNQTNPEQPESHTSDDTTQEQDSQTSEHDREESQTSDSGRDRKKKSKKKKEKKGKKRKVSGEDDDKTSSDGEVGKKAKLDTPPQETTAVDMSSGKSKKKKKKQKEKRQDKDENVKSETEEMITKAESDKEPENTVCKKKKKKRKKDKVDEQRYSSKQKGFPGSNLGEISGYGLGLHQQ